jgi:hypothetical protein
MLWAVKVAKGDRVGRVLSLLALSLLVLAGCRDKHEWHQKLTVVVETPAGERSGAAVVEVRAAFGRIPLSGNEVEYHYTGEATVVEVAPGKYLFALLGGTEERFACSVGTAMNWGSGPWSPGPGSKDRGEWLAEIPQMAGQPPAPVPPRCLPMLVTFSDISDPKSVQRVDPEDLAASFGPGMRLKAVTLGVTEESVTEGQVEAVLGWLLEAGKSRFNVAKTPDGDIPLNAFLSSDHWSK